MTKANDPNLESFVDIDNLWYFDSVVSKKPPSLKKSKRSKRSAAAKSNDQKPAAGDDQSNAPTDVPESQVSQLPLSTGGGSAAFSGYNYPDPGSDSGEATVGKRCATCKRGEDERPCMCDLVKKMEKGVGELPPAELHLWMEKLGLEYTEDGTMIRRIPNTSFGSQQKLDFSEFVCLNRFIEEERNSPRHAKQHTLYEVFRLFDKEDTGLISPSDLCAALAKLGLRGSS